jgi:hypothetical protein
MFFARSGVSDMLSHISNDSFATGSAFHSARAKSGHTFAKLPGIAKFTADTLSLKPVVACHTSRTTSAACAVLVRYWKNRYSP